MRGHRSAPGPPSRLRRRAVPLRPPPSQDTAAGVAGPRILDASGELQLSARKEISLLSGLLGRTSLLTRLFPKSPLVKSEFPALGEVSLRDARTGLVF